MLTESPPEADSIPSDPSLPAPAHPVRSSLVLLLTAFIWGLAFVAQRMGMDYIGPFLFAGLRFWLGAATLALVLAAQAVRGNRQGSRQGSPMDIRRLAWAGSTAGLLLFAGGALQQVGLVYTTASKAGFLTALYIVLVPVLGLFAKHRAYWNTWLGVALAVVGLYLLTIKANLTIDIGDLIVIAGAFFWAGHILAVDHFVGSIGQREVLVFCIAQFVCAGSLGIAMALCFDGYFVSQVFDLAALQAAALPILYAGILSTGVAFTLQAIGQQGLAPATAAIIMSLEAVFSVLGGVVILSESLTAREGWGSLIMFAAVILAQLPGKRRDSNSPLS